MRYDPNVYSYDALDEDGQRFIDGFDCAVECVKNRDYIDYIVDCMPATFGRITREVAEEVIDNLLDYLAKDRQEAIVGLIEAGGATNKN